MKLIYKLSSILLLASCAQPAPLITNPTIQPIDKSQLKIQQITPNTPCELVIKYYVESLDQCIDYASEQDMLLENFKV